MKSVFDQLRNDEWLGQPATRAVGEAVEGVSGVVYKTVTIVTGKRR